MNKRIKNIFLIGILFIMPLAGNSQDFKDIIDIVPPSLPSEEFKIVIEGLAPLILVGDNKPSVDIIAVAKDKDGNDFAETIFQNIQAVKAEPNEKDNSIVTFYWQAKDHLDTSASAKLEEFKKENPAALFSLSVRNWKDDGAYNIETSSFQKLFE